MLYKHQIELAQDAAEILLRLKIVYLAFEMRVGKTLTALEACRLAGFKNVLFVTKKKAKSSIQKDYENEGYVFKLDVVNYEQLKNVKPGYDCVVADEAHSFGAYPKPAGRTKYLKEIVGSAYLILLSGTPTPESHSQIYHQFWLSANSPFAQTNFYKWAKEFVLVKQKRVSNGMLVNDYSEADREKIMRLLKPYFIHYTQTDAGFRQAELIERIEYVKPDARIYKLADWLLKKRYFQMLDGSEIVCDTAVKLQQKLHQIFSGTVRTEDGGFRVLDTAKAKYILDKYGDKKIAVFYKFIAEGKALRSVLGNVTEDPMEFNNCKDKVFLSQVQSGAMGVDLSTADILIFYNIDFSSTIYWQSRARIQNMKREAPAEVVWLFTKNGIEDKIYQAVMQKRDYTLYYFRRDYEIGSGRSKENIGLFEKQGRLCG